MKSHLVTLCMVLGLMAAATCLDAQPTADEKTRINLEIDRRLGWIGKDTPPSRPAPAAVGLPNHFAWENSRFMQPGPPPYSQQPEHLNDVSLSFALAEGRLSNLPVSRFAKVVRQIQANPAIRNVTPNLILSTAVLPEGYVAVETPSADVQFLPENQVATSLQAGGSSSSSLLQNSGGGDLGGVIITSVHGGGSLTILGGATLTLGGGTLSMGGERFMTVVRTTLPADWKLGEPSVWGTWSLHTTQAQPISN